VEIEKRLGLNVRKLREAKGLSQEEFGFESGLHRTYVSDIERGTRNPTVRIVQQLADCLGVSPGSLLD
jgi:transcriptional regulator with XRE-family HTH domain